MNDSNIVSIQEKRLQKVMADILYAAPAMATKEQQDELMELLPDTPKLAAFLCKPSFVKVAYDDIDNLRELELILSGGSK